MTQHGSLNLNHWGTVFLLGQLALTAPLYLVFGVHPVLAVLWTWAMGMVGLFGVAALGRRCRVPRKVVLVLLATLSLCPLFFLLDATFMTDVPSFTLMVLTMNLWVGCTTPRFDRRRWLALALATVAFTIREPAAMVALPILLEPLRDARRQGDTARRRRTLLWAALWVVGLAVAWKLRQGISTSGWEPSIHLTVGPFLASWAEGWLPATLGFFLLPVLLATAPWDLLPGIAWHHKWTTRAIEIVFVAVPAVGLLVQTEINPNGVQIGNYVSLDPFIPLSVRVLLSLLGLLSLATAALVGVGAYRRRAALPQSERRALGGLAGILIAYSAFLLVARLFGVLLWDRYWLIVIAVGALLLARAGHLLRAESRTPAPGNSARWGRRAMAVALALCGLYGTSVVLDTNAYQAGLYNFATDAATHLPRGFTGADLGVDWLWNATRATSGSGHAADAHPHGIYVFPANDGTGSFTYIYQGVINTCAPFVIVTEGHAEASHQHVIELGPVSTGVFDRFQFAVVRQPLKECRNEARNLHVPL